MRLTHLVLAVLIALYTRANAQTTTTNCTTFQNQLHCTQNTLQPPDNSLVQSSAAIFQGMALQQAAEVQAAWAAAGRQAEQAAVTAKERMEQTTTAIQSLTKLALSEPPTLKPVNTGLATNWSTLDGITTSREYKLDGGVRRRLTIRLALNPTPEGGRFIQMRMDSRILVQEGLFKRPAARETLDGRYDLTTGVTLLTSSVEPLRPDVAPLYEAIALIGEHAYLSKMNGTSQFKAPIGTVPSPVFDFVIAAMPGALSDSISLWTLDWETGNVLLAQLSLQKRMMEKIPVATGGAACEEGTATQKTELPVIIYKLRMGTTEKEKIYLEHEPHLPVPNETKCVDMKR